MSTLLNTLKSWESRPTSATSSDSSGNNRSAPANSNPDGTTLGNFIFVLFILRAYADVLYIYPNKRKKVSFESKRDEILRNGVEAAMSGRPSDSKNPKGKTESTKGAGAGMST
jgi:hypothetical protein